ncbi:tannase and feruloyl esterase [Poronia punctata]|nr:tannase and feruloyl esterase [Poronia punctata]
MFKTLTLILAASALATAEIISPRTRPVACESLSVNLPYGARLLNLTATERYNVTYGDIPASVDICDVEIYLTHRDAGDVVRTAIWLPLDKEKWNGRFQGTGGGGYSTGYFDSQLLPPVALGYAAGSTDGGVGEDGDPPYWHRDQQLIENFVHLSIHEMTVMGKEITELFYGIPPAYSYWYGCSTGGRQGLREVQSYPDDYDGVFVGAPATNWTELLTAMFWPVVAQKSLAEPLNDCQLNFITDASVAACDELDGAADGIIGNPLECNYDPAVLVGVEYPCDEDSRTVTEEDAAVWAGIRDGLHDANGKRLFYGLREGANYTELSVKPSFDPPRQWIADFLLDDEDADLDRIGLGGLVELFYKAEAEFGDLWGTTDADISAFKERGGKIITWHGWADQCIAPENTIDYWGRVVDEFGDKKEVDDFYRVFLVPGLSHCYGGPGPQPDLFDTISPLVEWVEAGKVPDTLLFDSGDGPSRNICKYPEHTKYKGSGDVTKAENWECVSS